ncbi:MAG: LapA family protein [Nitrospinota bacterium]|nr:LapA family protein [Nitrospinota bacterium]
MGGFRLVLGFVLAIAIALFGVKNFHLVMVQYYFGKSQFPLFFILIITFSFGFFICWFASLSERFRTKRLVRFLERRISSLGGEIRTDEFK